MNDVARCPGCETRHPAGTTCQAGRNAAWEIVKDREVRRQFPKLYRWARAYLGLTDESEKVA